MHHVRFLISGLSKERSPTLEMRRSKIFAGLMAFVNAWIDIR